MPALIAVPRVRTTYKLPGTPDMFPCTPDILPCTQTSTLCTRATLLCRPRWPLCTAAAFEAVSTQWDSAQQARVDTFPKALALATGIAASVKGHPKYGANCTTYAAMGYTTTGARSSGLTRRRDAETPKETA
jgi:hypothetical protein